MELVWRYIPNDDGTPRWVHTLNVTPSTTTWQDTKYIDTMYNPSGNDRSYRCWFFTGLGGKIFNYTGSSASNWKIPSFHMDCYIRSMGSVELGIYYAFGGSNGGFLKTKSNVAWVNYSDRYIGSLSVTSVSSTVSGGLTTYTCWDCTEITSGSVFIGIEPGSSSYNHQISIRNLWFDLSTFM